MYQTASLAQERLLRNPHRQRQDVGLEGAGDCHRRHGFIRNTVYCSASLSR